jgi:cation:H+ antiporter
VNTVTAIILLVLGLAILCKCADYLVAGAVGLARRLGLSPLVIGLTIVAMGTSAPEVAASIADVFREGGGDIALGNVYGSNIANLLLVGGLATLISPIMVKPSLLRREIPVMLAVAFLLWPVLYDLSLTRAEAVLLLLVFVTLLALLVYSARKEGLAPARAEHIQQEVTKIQKPRRLALDVFFIIIGLIGLAVGAKMSIAGAVFIGRKIGLSEAVIGLTIIAIGTSLPELATSVMAVLKKQHDISIGNLVGSNIFNTLLVTGTAGTLRPFQISSRLIGADYWTMIVVSLAFAAIPVLARKRISRVSGAMLLAAYIAYLAYLFTAGA